MGLIVLVEKNMVAGGNNTLENERIDGRKRREAKEKSISGQLAWRKQCEF